MNHDAILNNPAHPLANNPQRPEFDEWIIALRDNHHDFSMDAATILQCLRMLEQEGAVPELSDAWWTSVACRYNISLMD